MHPQPKTQLSSILYNYWGLLNMKSVNLINLYEIFLEQ